MREGELHSWAVDYVWQPGENRAECLAQETPRCPRSPGRWCRCGFWALYSPMAAMRLASAKPTGRAVMGLIKGFGTVALHGNEGFRAEMAMVTCIFADEIALAPAERLWRSVLRRFRESTRNSPNDPMRRDTHAMTRLAGDYEIPLVSLQSALSVGLLAELGVKPDAITELRGWLTQRRRDTWSLRRAEHA